MLCAIIAAADEETTIENVLIQARRAGCERCIVVVNGSTDETLTRANRVGTRLFKEICVIDFQSLCGPDISHTIGLVHARLMWPDTEWFLLLDGDLAGAFGPALETFVAAAFETQAETIWMASHDTEMRTDQALWRSVLAYTRPSLISAQPAQVPRLIHTSVLAKLPQEALIHPGFWLAHCAQSCRISAASIPFDARILGNKSKSRHHQQRMQETLIGDALEGIRVLLKKKPHRRWQGKLYLGYHPARRLDLLFETLQSRQIFV